eukprot:CAMPEP_0181289408 /NCGR_PEP_ID=MMETSP1101-20121128/866_1 /TAXON_ID=46948 /ORGANISM="Rhodomonas abbreviata, Strain Caron Lab Isolate" /LENGTH=157 /DNA_ID=CAMNT_0023393627 /DNA_START=173 /DNA_END=643 /DNA_ORIENTATION=+
MRLLVCLAFLLLGEGFTFPGHSVCLNNHPVGRSGTVHTAPRICTTRVFPAMPLVPKTERISTLPGRPCTVELPAYTSRKNSVLARFLSSGPGSGPAQDDDSKNSETNQGEDTTDENEKATEADGSGAGQGQKAPGGQMPKSSEKMEQARNDPVAEAR